MAHHGHATALRGEPVQTRGGSRHLPQTEGERGLAGKVQRAHHKSLGGKGREDASEARLKAALARQVIIASLLLTIACLLLKIA